MAEDIRYYVLIRERVDGILGKSISKTVSETNVKPLYELLDKTPSTQDDRYNKLEM